MKKSLAVLSLLALTGGGCFGATTEVKTEAEVKMEKPPVVEEKTAPPATTTEEAPAEKTEADVKLEVEGKVNVEKDTTVNVNVGISVKTYAVAIQNFAFSQKSLTVKKGDKITFTNKDGVAHTSTADAGAWESGLLSKDASWTLDTSTLAPGTYSYHCTPHPNMTATVIVQ